MNKTTTEFGLKTAVAKWIFLRLAVPIIVATALSAFARADLNAAKDAAFGRAKLCLIFNNVKGFKQVVSEHPEIIRDADQQNSTLLHWAAFALQAEAVTYLLQKQADPFVKNNLGETPLEMARISKVKDQNVATESARAKVIQLLQSAMKQSQAPSGNSGHTKNFFTKFL